MLGVIVKLSICIPTHHGRVATLRDLLESIVRQRGFDAREVEVCISDNASADGTAQLVAGYQRSSPFAIRYFRFETDMRGVRNFLNAVQMASGEYCWLIGSDDAVLEDGIARVLAAVGEHGVEGLTVNKLNLDHELARFVGPDARPALPSEPRRTRVIEGFEAIMAELGILFTYMSSHVFRRRAWQAVVGEHGLERLLWTRHFPHTFVFSQIARGAKRWLWLGEYCVAQRMSNFCLLEEKNHRGSLYATEVLEDLDHVWGFALEGSSAAYRSLMFRQFLFYWNPFGVRQMLCEPAMTDAEARALRSVAVRCFRRLPLFWLTTYPVLVMPRFLLRWTLPLTSFPAVLRSSSWRRALGAVGVDTGLSREFDSAEALARQEIARRSESAKTAI
jgi:abequosyltransferase